jgi:hypothetical protein
MRFLEWVEQLIQKESGSANFGTKLAPSLNGADLSFMNSVTGSVCRAKCSNILYDSYLVRKFYKIWVSFCFFNFLTGGRFDKDFYSCKY